MANRIDLVRHPKKEGENEGLYLGTQAQITSEGWEETEVLINRLMRMPHDVVVTSQIPRAIQLARVYAERLGNPEPESFEFFNEIDKPQWLVGLHRSDPIHVRVMKTIRDSFDSARVPLLTTDLQQEIACRLGLDLPLRINVKGRRALEAQMQRIFNYFDSLDANTALCVTHAKLIGAILHWQNSGQKSLKGFYQTTDRNYKFHTTGITTLVREPDRRTGELHWHIEAVNDTSHYDAAKHQELEELLKQLP